MFMAPEYVSMRLKIRPETRVLDVGGSAAPFPTGEVTIVDVAQPKTACHDFVQLDVCRQPLPFAENHFDVCICSHTLEDLYNPFLAMDEIQRVARAGYIETPSRGLESCFAVMPDVGTFPGWGHHRWMFQTVGPGKFRVTSKSWQLLCHGAELIVEWHGPSVFEFFWREGFDYEIVDGLHEGWKGLVSEHNRFVEENRALLRTVRCLQPHEIAELSRPGATPAASICEPGAPAGTALP